MSNNCKRSAGRRVQTIRCAEKITVDGEMVSNPEAGRLKQIKHPVLPDASGCDLWGMSKSTEWENKMRHFLSNRL